MLRREGPTGTAFPRRDSSTSALDATTAAVVCGGVTSRIELGTRVVPIYSRHPYFMAQQALTTQAAVGGRFVLGIGLSHQRIAERMFGGSYAQPVSYVREYLAVLGGIGLPPTTG